MLMKDLYLEKIAILRKVLQLTKSVEFSGNHDADEYIDLIAKREEWLEKAKEIDKRMVMAENTPETEKFTQEIVDLSRQIIEQDNYMKATVLKIFDAAKSEIKNINTGKSLNNLYGSTHKDSGIAGHDWSQ